MVNVTNGTHCIGLNVIKHPTIQSVPIWTFICIEFGGEITDWKATLNYFSWGKQLKCHNTE